jgi:hypothetical protein
LMVMILVSVFMASFLGCASNDCCSGLLSHAYCRGHATTRGNDGERGQGSVRGARRPRRTAGFREARALTPCAPSVRSTDSPGELGRAEPRFPGRMSRRRTSEV